MAMSSATFRDLALANPVNAALAERLPALGIGQCLLCAGCLFQAVWNAQAGRPPDWGVKDYDLFYFDADTRWEAEDAVIQRVREAFADLPVNIDIKNQARVHLWYRERFGGDYPPLHNARQGVDRYLVAGTCVALDVADGSVYATYGLEDVEHGVLRPNPRIHSPALFAAKAASYRARWPWLRVVGAGEWPTSCS
ncbi:nucleotidyltransferase family protein [Pseudomonas sp. NPDC007930]|uniref:nucleotidyltransferase family protein n=1 Tax=Pseudomonas sp. NPDC007930 TaxID=3364417 RepID=UPI0036E97627